MAVFTKFKRGKVFGLTAQIVTPILCFLVVMNIFIFSWSFYLSKITLESELALDIEKTESIVSLSLENTLEDIKDDLIEMTLTADFKGALATGKPDFIEDRLYKFLGSKQGYLLDIMEVFRGGNRFVDAGVFEIPVMQLRAKHKNTLATLPTWGHLSFIARDQIRTILICAIPVTSDETGEVLGVLYGGIDLNSNVSFIDSLKKSSSAIDAALISKKRLIISTKNPAELNISKLIKWSHKIIPGDFLIQGDLIFSTIQILPEQNGSPLIFAFSKLNPSFQSLKMNYIRSLGLMISLTLILSIITAWMMQKRILTALRKLTFYADSVAKGDSEASFVRGRVNEFNLLGELLEKMVKNIEEKSRYITSLFSSAKAPIINCDLHGNIIDMNPAAETLVNISHPLSHETKLTSLFPKEHSKNIEQYLEQAASGQIPPSAVIPLYTMSAEEQFFVWTFSPVKLSQKGNTNFILLQGQNVTENRIAVQKALESEARLRQIIDLLPQEIFANDTNGKFLLVNKNKAERMNLDASEIIDKNLSEVFDNPNEISRIQDDDLLVIERDEKLLIEESYIDKNRDIHWLETTKVPYISEETHAQAILTISMDITRIKEAENTLQHLNKELVERVSMRTIELENANTALTKSMDELRQTQNKLVETEKMASLGELVAGIAHEVNTPLGIGVTSTSYLKEITEELQNQFSKNSLKKSDLEKYINTSSTALENIVKNLNRAAKLISDFKQLAVDQSTEDLRYINLLDYIQGILLSLKPKLKEFDHSLAVNCPDDLNITISPGSLMLVISNLVMNSIIHAFPDKKNGSITIEAKSKDSGILLTFADNGIGLENEQLLKIYDPFYTTARSTGSTGLGMHLVYNLVTRALKGRIECKSTPGQGTTFEIWFPAATSQANNNWNG